MHDAQPVEHCEHAVQAVGGVSAVLGAAEQGKGGAARRMHTPAPANHQTRPLTSEHLRSASSGKEPTSLK